MIAMSDVSATIGLVAVFFVAFPALAHVLIGFAVAQGLGERQANEKFAAGIDDE
ncbi:hypothetical protein [Paraconexibacter sp.]|uniref:hypothetical protein n=1 Tax=Paraconexibacter sp. TaxID=2949640 RepID=UPI00356270B7